MNELFILSKATLKRADNTVLVQIGRNKNHIPVQNLKDIYVLSDLDLNSKFVQFISGHNINLHYFSYYGNYLGCYKPVSSRQSGSVLIEQVKSFTDFKNKLVLAKSFISAAARNMLRTMRYYNNRKKANLIIYRCLVSN